MGIWANAIRATEDNKVARIEKKSSKQAGGAPTMLVKARSRQTRDLLIRHGWWLRETTSAGVAPIVQYMMEKRNPNRESLQAARAYQDQITLYMRGINE